MPNRMIRDWTASDKINSVSVHAERFFLRLIMKADDFGCYHADSRLLKASLYPLLLDSIREADLLRWMTECQKAGLIVLYGNAGKKYLQIVDFRQRLDKARSKYPLPSVNDFRETVNEFPAEVETEVEPEVEEEKYSAGAPEVFKAFDSDRFGQAWQGWKNYKKKEHRFSFKSPESENAAQKKLKEMAGADEETAIAIIAESIAQGWKGFFELKTKPDAGNQQSAAGGNGQAGNGTKLGTSAARIDAAKKW